MEASAQTPSQILRVAVTLDQMEYTNLGPKTITAVVLHRVPPQAGVPDWQNYTAMDWGAEPLKPGQSRAVGFQPGPGVMQVEPAAVIFEDGSVLGAARTPDVDLVQGIFISRQRIVDAWSSFLADLGPSPTAYDFISFARTMQVSAEKYSAYDFLRVVVQGEASELNMQVKDPNYGAQLATAKLRGWLTDRSNRAAQLAIRKAVAE